MDTTTLSYGRAKASMLEIEIIATIMELAPMGITNSSYVGKILNIGIRYFLLYQKSNLEKQPGTKSTGPTGVNITMCQLYKM